MSQLWEPCDRDPSARLACACRPCPRTWSCGSCSSSRGRRTSSSASASRRSCRRSSTSSGSPTHGPACWPPRSSTPTCSCRFRPGSSAIGSGVAGYCYPACWAARSPLGSLAWPARSPPCSSRALTGALQGSLFSNDRAIIATVTPADRIGLGQGVSFSGPGIGLTFGFVIGGLLLELMPWRHVMLLFALGPIAAALLIARYVPAPAPAASRVPVGQRLVSLVSNGRLCTLALVSLCAIGDQFILATWAPLFFTEVGVTDVGRAGSYAALQGVAASLAMIASGWAHDRLVRRGYASKSVIVAGLSGLVVSMLAMAVAIEQRSIAGLAVVLFAAAFFCWSIWGAVYTLLARMVRVEELGTAFGFSNSISFLGAIVGPIATGWARDLTGSFSAGCVLAALLASAGVVLAAVLRVPPAPRPPRLPRSRAENPGGTGP